MKKFALCIFCLLIAAAVYAQRVDVEELQTEETVVFINFEGRQTSLDQEVIRNIGADMARQLLAGKIKGAWADKYSAVHLFDTGESDMLGADLITIEANAKVNHINSVRLILAGFLEDYYAYSRTDSDILAFFTTIYNALYRGDLGYYQEKYQNVVMDLIDPQTVGIALDYREWPGAADMVVPLTDKAERQDVRALDTSILTDTRIIEAVRAQPDRALDERKGMVDIKEREVVVTEEEIAESKEAVAVAEKEIEAAEVAVAEKEEEISKAEGELAAEKEALEKTTDEEEKARKEEEIQQQEQQLAEEKAAQESRQEELAEKKEAVEAEKAEIAEAEKDVEDKKAEIERDRETIARDERLAEVEKAIEEEPEKVAEQVVALEEERKTQPTREPIVGGKLYYLKVKTYLTDGHYANDLYIINALTGEYITKAPERPHIAGHKYEVIAGEGVMVLTDWAEKEAHYLTLLDLDTLEMLVVGSDDIYHLSFIERRGDYVYAVVFHKSDDCRLGKFNARTLELVKESEVQIDKNTVFHMSANLIFVNNEKKDMVVIDSSTMEVENTIKLP